MADPNQDLIDGMNSLNSSVSELEKTVKDLVSQMSAGNANANTINTDATQSAAGELTQSLGKLVNSLNQLTGVDSAAKELKENIRKTAADLDKIRQRLNDSLSQTVITAIANKFSKNLDPEGLAIVIGRAGKLISEAMEMAANGIKNAARLSISAQEGVGLEFSNQLQSIQTIFSFDANKIINKEAIYNAQEGVVEALGGLSENLQLDPDKITAVVQNFRTGLNSQITPTAETFKTLSALGIKPTTEALGQLRDATGRAAIGQAQMDVLNKNRMALQIFGMQLSKTALDFDRVGISLQSVMATGESYVTNLDGAVDAIAQLQQLGSNIDFGQLSVLAEFQPEEALKYVAANVTTDQLQSSSFRAQLALLPGMNAQIVTQIQQMKGLGNTVEDATTSQRKSADESNMASKSLAFLSQTASVLKNSFVTLIGGAIGLGLAVYRLTGPMANLTVELARLNAQLKAMTATPAAGANPAGAVPATTTAAGAGAASAAQTMSKGAQFKSTVGGNAAGGAAIGGIMGLTSGISTYAETKSIKKAVIAAVGPLLGSILGGILASVITVFTGGSGLILAPMLMALGGTLGSTISNSIVSSMDDGIVQPDGTFIKSPKGTVKLNNADTVVAGTELSAPASGKGAATAQTDILPLVRKLEQLIDTINSAKTTIQIDGTSRTVDRMQLVGVYTRDETVRTI